MYIGCAGSGNTPYMRLGAPVKNDVKGKKQMDVSLILKIAGVGVLVSVASAILNKSGRDEQAMFVTIAGIVVVMLMLVGEIGELFGTVQSVLGF